MLHSDRKCPVSQADFMIWLAMGVAIAMLLGGCAWFKEQIQNYKDMSPKEKALWMMRVYNGAYDDYQAQTANPEALTEEEKQVLRLKLKALKQAWPLVKRYLAKVESGVQDDETEAEAKEAVSAILTAGTGGVTILPVDPPEPQPGPGGGPQ